MAQLLDSGRRSIVVSCNTWPAGRPICILGLLTFRVLQGRKFRPSSTQFRRISCVHAETFPVLGQWPNVRTCIHDLRFLLQKPWFWRIGVSKCRMQHEIYYVGFCNKHSFDRPKCLSDIAIYCRMLPVTSAYAQYPSPQHVNTAECITTSRQSNNRRGMLRSHDMLFGSQCAFPRLLLSEAGRRVPSL